MVFKGGTSLSKGWGIIERFSEDIDLALDRKFLGFTGEMSKNQVDKLRRVSHQYIREQFFPAIKMKFEEVGLEDVTFHLPESASSDKDPQTIEISYPSFLSQASDYIRPRVLIEIGSRSLHEPFSQRPIRSFVGDYFEGQAFADSATSIPCVNVERTFLEKLFLLHEEFQKPQPSIRTHRLSRHLYDIDKIMGSEYSEKSLRSPELYQEIVSHRSKLTRINGLDITKHAPRYLSFVPPEAILKAWGEDYKIMQEQMIYGKSLPFQELIEQLTQLQSQINRLDWEIDL
ncbi:hypothetical protein ADIS_2611 [Lunatimonas lonarensis]|uniref:Nucleotidyl transferase AbiEii/AbiGii toxin family protein n=1 Tax=Lunatimonas lonarensis TaxID=1232681 RepID=R7ZS65_9BACT|nr:nucleotidyl transferase AbiEii/AbiGii toxin family protein [Lunatimonas lonarensis]EON76950.1 hypothetical protein ADIS_2611 [Lunatimonas lonarensis]